jgi:HEAT repeat protein
LGDLGDKGAVDVLLHSLRHEALPSVRASAARALESLADASAVDDLIVALEDSDDSVRLRATLALVAIGDKGAVEPLKALISVEDSYQIRAAASQAVETLEGA